MGCGRVHVGGFIFEGATPYRVQVEDSLLQLREVERMFSGSGVKARLEVHFGTIHASAAGTLALIQ